MPWTYVISDHNVETFYEKELEETNQKEFRTEKVIKANGNKLCVNGKGTMILLTVGLIKKA